MDSFLRTMDRFKVMERIILIDHRSVDRSTYSWDCRVRSAYNCRRFLYRSLFLVAAEGALR